jgi:D-sedoheptulose 7-phosphate isomerase
MQIDAIVKLLREKKKNGNTIFVCGNGGSAATAEHFTNDLFSKGIRAICLNSNVSIMTMIANDYGYDYIFSRQLVVYAKPDDLLIVFSWSGFSKNIVKASLVGLETIEIFGKPNESPQDGENRHLVIAHEISNGIT